MKGRKKTRSGFMSLVQRLRNLAQRAFAQDVVLRIDNEERRYRTLDEFDADLAKRLDVPPSSISRFEQMDDRRLKYEHDQAVAVHKRLLNHLVKVNENASTVVDLWREIDLSKIAEDHQWALIFFALNDESSVPEDFRRLAVARYLQYLNARRDILQAVLRKRRKQLQHQTLSTGQFEPGELKPAADVGEEGAGREPGSPVVPSGYAALPRGKAVEIVLPAGEEAVLLLSRERLKLRNGPSGLVLIEESGAQHELREGAHVVGRSRECNIVLADAGADVSRKHLLIECRAHEILLTDTSSRGTFVPRSILADTQTRH